MTNPPEPLSPIPPGSFSPAPKASTKKLKRLQYGLIVSVVVGLILLVLVVVYAVQASSNATKLKTATDDGQKQGAEAQKAIDDKKSAEEKISDTRTYTAPNFAGSFSVALPKLWSLSVTPQSGTNTLAGIANPDQIDTKAEKYALRFSLLDQPYSQAKSNLDQQTKQRTATGKINLSSQSAMISGIEGTRYIGQIANKITDGTIIMVPIRDKTFTIETDDNAIYLQVFNTILLTVKLNP